MPQYHDKIGIFSFGAKLKKVPTLPPHLMSLSTRTQVISSYTVNPLLSPLGGLFFSSTFEGGGGLKREGGLI